MHTKDQDRKQVPDVPEQWETASIRFAGDSGDGIQLAGNRFATISAALGDVVMTFADYPSEIRAPAGSIGGVSGYQLRLGNDDVYTTGDEVDILVAMNPAALKVNLDRLKDGGIIIVDKDSFNDKSLAKADWQENPLEIKGILDRYRVHPIEITTLTRAALKDTTLSIKDQDRCKNFFALGVVCWLLSKDIGPTLDWITQKFKKNAVAADANRKALEAGWNTSEATTIFNTHYTIKSTGKKRAPGTYRYLNGNTAAALGLAVATVKSGRKLFLGSYPITPATDILQELAAMKNFPITTFQAEDEIAGIGTALGASFAGNIGVTTTSGPGFSLKTEFLGLAVMTELPLVIINVQRAGPSTGLPTKTEQSDLLQALYGRNGDAPLVVLAASTPGDCFYTAYEAVRIAIKYMTPVVVLTDGYLANGAEGWRIPTLEDLPPIQAPALDVTAEDFHPYSRNPETLARPWAAPGTPGYEHRIGGLEKENVSGNVSHSPENHGTMTTLRAQKVQRVAQEYGPSKVKGKESGKLLVVSWGSTFGAARQAVENTQKQGFDVSHLNLRYLNPLPQDLGDILKRYDKVLLPEVNSGQLLMRLRSEYLVDVIGYSKVEGRPFRVSDLEHKIKSILGEM
jgi:2-oxoglutarate ferredoxin oxidoreductase subunit alpha